MATSRWHCLFFIFLFGHGFLVPPTGAATDCTNLLADIVFIMDASGSVTAPNFSTMKSFVVNFVQTIQSHISPNGVRIAVIRYESSASTMFYLQDHLFPTGLVSAINSISYTSGGTATHSALNLAQSVLSSNGARTGVTKLAVLLTDGQSNDASATQSSASSLRAAGVRIMAIGVGNANYVELQGVATSSSYVHTVGDFSALATIQQQLVNIACEPVCSWHTDYCWPGDCSHMLAANCVCRAGFSLASGTAKRCQLSTAPDLLTCRLTLKDSSGNEVRSSTSGTLQHCSNQQHEFMNIQPSTVVYDLKADLHQSVGSYPYYVSDSRVGVVGFKLKVTKVSISGAETTVSEVSLNQTPTCTQSVSSTNPTTLLDCSHTLAFSASTLTDGERLCIDMEALGGGFYKLQDFTPSPQGTQTFPTISTSRRICFTYDSTKPAHCSQSGSCSRSPLQLSTRLTRSPDIRVGVDQWLDPIPPGGNAGHASQVSRYILEVHGVDVASTFLSVQENALITTPLTGSAPYDVVVTLPATEPRLYAILLEVHDVAGNVGYARRLVLYDNSSGIALDPHRSLVVVSANPVVGRRWQTVVGDVCVDWTDRFYNDVFFHYDYMLPVKADSGREIQGQYDQVSGVLPVSGTPTTRGVVKFEVSWTLNSGVQSSWQNVPNVPAQNVCVSLPLNDGDTYDLTIRASDIMNNSNTDDVRVHVDHTAPVARDLGLRGRWGRAGLHVHDSTDLSRLELVMEGSDPHSGLLSIVWSLGTRPLGDDVGRRAVGVQRLNNVTSCGALNHCYCPTVGQCETFLYNLTFASLVTSNTHQGDHHRDYYITVNFTNSAGLTLSSPVQILIDVSPPIRGVALEGMSDDAVAEMDFTSQDVVHVRWHGFADHESGVLLYRVVLAQHCLTDREMDQASNATEVTSGTSASFRFPSEGRYFTCVVAYNGALTPSPVACSDGVVFDTSPPRLLNVSIAHARARRSVACSAAPGDTAWLVNANLTRIRLANATACSSLCSSQVNGTRISLDHLAPTTAFALGETESDELCRSLPRMTEDSWIVLPSDRLMLTWASEDGESEMEDFHVGVGSSRASAPSPDLIPLTSTHAHHSFHRHSSGLDQGAIFYLFLQATSQAGLQTLVTMGPFLVDATPPQVTATLTAEVDGDQLVVSWEKGVVVDLEQPADIEFEFTFRVGHSDSFVTPYLPVPASLIADCRLKNASIAGCLRYPISSLHEHDARAGRSFFFQLHVQNAAGHITSVNTSSVRLPARVSQGVVLDILPSAAVNSQLAASEVVEDVDVIVEPSVVCVAWSDLRLRSGHGDIEVQIGVGSSSASDDIITFSPADVTAGRACVNASRLPPYTRLYSLVRATVSGSSALFSSDGFMSIPSNDTANRIRVFNGRGCSEKDRVGAGTLAPHTASFNLTVDVPLHPGDLLFVSFDPFIPGVRFQNAIVMLETLTGYQVVLGSNSLSAVIPTPTPGTGNTSVEVHNCQKEQSLVLDGEEVVSTWDIQGPWARLSTSLRVEMLDRTCLQRTATAQLPQNDIRRCLVAETRTSPHLRTHAFGSLSRLHGHYYVTSVAVCFDDQCLPPAFSDDVYVTSGKPALTVDEAVLLSQTSSRFELDVSASGQPSLAHRPCIFLWSVARCKDASHLLSDWRLRNESRGCSSLQTREQFAYSGSGHGSLYVCLRPIFPRPSHAPTCKLIARAARANQIQPFHVIEISHTTLRETDFDAHLHSQQLGSKLHDLYDLDLDFVTSDLLLAALVTNSYGREVRWFVMTEARFPAGDSCAGDRDCVTSSVSHDGKIVFPRQSTDFEHGVMYYVCALISARGLDPKNHSLAGYNDIHRTCGDGFVVDDELPVAGTVAITSADSGYLADGGRVMVTWEGFSDVEKDVTHLPDNATLAYSVALGSYPGAEDLASLTEVGHRTAWTFHNLPITSGIFCYATVRAKDRVGHVMEVSSDAVVLDNTPPSEGRVITGSFMGDNYLPGHMLHVRWEGITDLQSGVASQFVAVSMRGGHDDVISFTRVQGSSVTINGSFDLVDGHSYVVLLKSTNQAGLSTLTSSEPFIVDSSPPVLGSVWNGSPNSNEHVSYLTDQDAYSVQWSGFHDPHSDVAFYRVGLGTSAGADNVVAFHYVGLRTAYTWRRQLDQGRKYFAVVEACNQAGLCSTQSSSSLIFDSSPPTSGHVLVGTDGRHSGFYGHNTTLQAEWIGFSDPQSGIREFWWCVGTQPGTCDVKPFSTSLQTRFFTGAVASLPVGTPLYLTVRAINFAGLTTEGASDSFVVDTTPPVSVTPPTFSLTTRGPAIHSQYDRSLLRVAWDFQDPDSPIASYTVSIRGQRQGRQALEPVNVATDSHLTVHLGPDELVMDGELYRATVVACNTAGLCATVTSDPLLVDSTPPVVGKFLSQLPWLTAFSNGTVETTINVTWTGFTEEESQVVRYHFTAGKTYGDSDVSDGALTVSHDNASDFQNLSLSLNQSLSAGDLLVMSVWAENSLGLFSALQRMTFEVFLDSAAGDSGSLLLQRHSCSPHYCTNECTCAPTGHVCQPTAPSPCVDLPANNHSALADIDIAPFLGRDGEKLSFISSASCLEGFWEVSGLNSTSAISRFEYSFSLANEQPGMGVFDPRSEPVWHDCGLRTSAVYCLPAQRALHSGSSYALHVRAWLTRDSYVTVTSPPLVADLSPPSRRRGRSVTESDSSCNGDLDFVTQQASVTSCWAGVFSDAQSGIAYYEVWVGNTPYGDNHQTLKAVGKSTSMDLDLSSMAEGTRYYVTVRAWNGAGLSTTVMSDGIVKDHSPPRPGHVFLSSRHAADHVTEDVTTLTASWHGFEDLQSGVAAYSVALFDVGDLSTPVVDFVEVGFQTEHVFHGLSLQHRHSYEVAVKAFNAAGLESSPALSAAMLVDVTPPEGVTCTRFQLEGETSLSYTPTPSFRHETYNASLELNVPARKHLLKMVVTATALNLEALGELIVEPHLRMPLTFRFDRSSNARAEHVFLAPAGGRTRVDVEVRADAGASVSARVFSCAKSSPSSAEAVTLRQLSDRAVSVCTTVVDEESDVMSLWVGVGSTPGGLQLQPFMPLGQGGHVEVEVSVQQGTPLYATVLVENHAETWSRFISQPVVMDTTPPIIDQLNVTITYSANASSLNVTAATAIAKWTVGDAESGSVSCTCELEGHDTVDDVVQARDDVRLGECQWRLSQPRHGARVRAVVSCMNGVQISATETSSDATVLLVAPDISKAVLQFLPNFGLFSPYDYQPGAVVRSGTADLEVTWSGPGDATVDHFLYRFLSNQVPQTGWSPLPAYKTAAILEAGNLHGGNVTAEVRAVNSEAMTSDVLFGAVGIDDSRPALTGKNATGTLVNRELSLDWTGVFHTTRDVTYSVYAGTDEDFGDVMNQVVTKLTTYRGPCDVTVDRLFVVVQAVYTNGLNEMYKAVVHL